ncbi:hypothetical protein [Phytohabitans kaempferiae]|uniref:Uncharacterized protein n=1 Tax=Phytohabitans kaempferiae TaxID=1620943 RepID=A0ABV6LXL9_9ACTN
MSAAEQAFAALTAEQRACLLRNVFEVLEYDVNGRPGGEWSSDTTQGARRPVRPVRDRVHQPRPGRHRHETAHPDRCRPTSDRELTQMGSYYIGAQIEIRPLVPAHTLPGTRYLADDTDSDSEVVVIDHGDHSRIVPRDHDRQTNRSEAIVGDVQGLVDILGPDYSYRGALRIDDPSGEPPSRFRVVVDGERRTAIREDADL